MVAISSRGFAVSVRVVVLSLVLSTVFPLGTLPTASALGQASAANIPSTQSDPDAAMGASALADTTVLPLTGPTLSEATSPSTSVLPIHVPTTPYSAPTYSPLAPVASGPLSFTFSLSATPAQASVGDIVTYTLTVTNTQGTALAGLTFQSDIHRALRWGGGADLPPQAQRGGGHVNGILPAVPPRTTRTFVFTALVQGVPAGTELAQGVVLGQNDVYSTTQATVTVAHPHATGMADARGGGLASADGRVRIDVPAGALDRDVTLDYTPNFVTAYDGATSPYMLALTFNAHDRATGEAVHAFARPVSLTLQVGDLLPAGVPFFLHYWNPDTHAMEPIAGPLTPDAQGFVRIALPHFSTMYGGGDLDKSGWKLQFSDANVSAFSGDVSYSVPLDVPAGRHGMQPGLALSYGSARVGKSTEWVQSDWVGAGFSIDAVEITRKLAYSGLGGNDTVTSGNDLDRCQHQGDLCFRNQYTLVFNGTGGELVDAGNGLFRIASDPFLKIERIVAATYTTPNACPNGLQQGGYTAELQYQCVYWQVTTSAGTVYRLGFRADSEQRHSRVCIAYHNYGTDEAGTRAHWCGDDWQDVRGPVVWRWRVDQVMDVYGNKMEYNYREESASSQYTEPCGQDFCYTFRDAGLYGAYDRASYLDWIGYTWRPDINDWGYKVVFDRRCRTDNQDGNNKLNTGYLCATQSGSLSTDGMGDSIQDAWHSYGTNAAAIWWQTRYLYAVRVLQMTAPSTATVVREYRFGYDVSGDRTGNNSDGLASRVLTSVTQYGLGGCCTSALPATTFGYTGLPNGKRLINEQENVYDCSAYQYGRINQIQNGYGATIALTYTSYGSGWCYKQYNWVVTQKVVSDGGLTPALYSLYDYTQPCYADTQAVATLICYPARDNLRPFVRGFGKVTVSQRQAAANGTLLGKSVHRFYPDDSDWSTTGAADLGQRFSEIVGREKVSQVISQTNGVDWVASETRTIYTGTVILDKTGVDEFGDPYTDATFVHPDEVIQSQYNSAGTLLVQTRQATTYEYTNGQGTAQYAYGLTRVLTNGSFENGLDYDTQAAMWKPKGWSALHNQGLPTTVQLSVPAEAKVIGNAGLSLVHTGAGICICGATQTVTKDITIGTTYIVTARVRKIAGTPAFSLWAQSGTNSATVTPTWNPSGAWQIVTAQVTAQASNLAITLVLNGSTAGTAYVDDVYFEAQAQSGDETMQATWYLTNAAGTIVVPHIQRTYSGLLITADGTELTMTRMVYDNSPVNGTNTVTLGTLTAQAAYHTPSANWMSTAYYNTTRMQYDAYGNQTSITDALIHTSSIVYDPTYHTYPVQYTNQKTQSGYFTYDYALGKIIHAVDMNGVATDLVYDTFGRVAKVIEAGDSVTYPTTQYNYYDTYTAPTGERLLRIETWAREQSGTSNIRPVYEFYSGRGTLVQTRAELVDATTQSVSRVIYDALGRAVQTYTPVSKNYSVDYKPNDVPTSTPSGQTVYDLLGRIVTQVAADGTTTRTAYDGVTTTIIDANGHQKQSIVDGQGQLITVKEYTGTVSANLALYATTQYAYSLLGQLTRVQDSVGRITTITYNTFGQKVAMDDPNMGAWSYTYDAGGNLLTQTDAKGAKTCFDYDNLNRMVTKRYNGTATCPATATDTYAYDEAGHGYGIGQRTTMTNSAAVTAWTYDARGRVTQETRTITNFGVYTFRMGYDTAGRIVTTTYPTGETITNTYNAAGQAIALQGIWAVSGLRMNPTLPWPQRTYIANATYDVRGQLLTRVAQLGNNSTQTASYSYYGDTVGDPLSFRLKRLQVNTNILDLAYTYDAAGNILSLTDGLNSNQVQNFRYDPQDRLTNAWTNTTGYTTTQYTHTGLNAYTYGPVGNLASLAGRTYVYRTARSQQARYTYQLGSSNGSAGRFDTLDTLPVNGADWTTSGCLGCQTATDGGEALITHNGSWSTLARTPINLVGGDTVQVEFKASAADFVLQLEDATTSPANTFGVIAAPGVATLKARYKVASGAFTTVDLNPALTFQPNRWYVLRLTAGTSTANTQIVVYERDNPAVRAVLSFWPGTVWNGKTWHFRNWLNVASSTAQLWLDSYFEVRGVGNVWNYAYDANGNMLARLEGSMVYSQTWDANNMLTRVQSGLVTASPTSDTVYTFGYDADSTRVTQTEPGPNGTSSRTAYAGAFEDTFTPTLSVYDTFANGVAAWTPLSGGSWSNTNGLYQQTQSGAVEATSLRNAGTNSGDLHASARVRLDAGTDALAGLTFHLTYNTGTLVTTNAYFVGVRNSLSTRDCGIYKKVNGTWESIKVSGGVACKVATGTWHTLSVRTSGGLIEFSLDGVMIATWQDSATLSAANFGLTAWGAASFDTLTEHDVTTYGDEWRTYYAFGGGTVAERRGARASSANSAAVLFLYSDHLGSVSALTKGTDGYLQGSSQYYYPYGDMRGVAPNNATVTDLGFTKQRHTFDIGLIHMGARWLDPKLAKFISSDTIVASPSKPRDLNRYAYAANNPLSFIDPNGHQVRTTCGTPGQICASGTEGGYVSQIPSPKHQPLTISGSGSGSTMALSAMMQVLGDFHPQLPTKCNAIPSCTSSDTDGFAITVGDPATVELTTYTYGGGDLGVAEASVRVENVHTLVGSSPDTQDLAVNGSVGPLAGSYTVMPNGQDYISGGLTADAGPVGVSAMVSSNKSFQFTGSFDFANPLSAGSGGVGGQVSLTGRALGAVYILSRGGLAQTGGLAALAQRLNKGQASILAEAEGKFIDGRWFSGYEILQGYLTVNQVPYQLGQ